MVEAVKTEEGREEYEDRRRKEKTLKKPVSEIKREKKETSVEKSAVYELKSSNRIESIKRLEPIILQARKSSELRIPLLKGFDSVRKTEKLAPVILRATRSIELRIPRLKGFHMMEWPMRIGPAPIEKDDHTPKLIIPMLREIMSVTFPHTIPPRKILKTATTKLVVPEVMFERIPHQTPVLLFRPSERLLEEEKAREEMEAVMVSVPEIAGSAIVTEEIPEFLDLIFERDNGGKIDSGKPVVIFLDELEGNNHIVALREICKRIYREKRGGKPEAKIISDPEELKKELSWLKAEEKIFSVQLDKKGWGELTKREEERIFNKMDQLFSQDVGFIVLNKIFVSVPERHRIDIVVLRPKELGVELTKRISEIAWGFVETEENDNFDYVFESARDKFEQTLRSIRKEGGGIYVDATKQHEGSEPESDEHLWIKWFLMRYLTQKLIEDKQLPSKPDLLQIKNRIRTEKETEDELDGISADIKVGSEVYEVETLFAQDCEGKIPRNKITHTIEKYEGRSVRKINIVLDNLTFIRYVRILKEIERNYVSWQKRNNTRIEFFTLDLRNSALVSLQDMMGEIRNITEEEAAF